MNSINEEYKRKEFEQKFQRKHKMEVRLRYTELEQDAYEDMSEKLVEEIDREILEELRLSLLYD